MERSLHCTLSALGTKASSQGRRQALQLCSSAAMPIDTVIGGFVAQTLPLSSMQSIYLRYRYKFVATLSTPFPSTTHSHVAIQKSLSPLPPPSPNPLPFPPVTAPQTSPCKETPPADAHPPKAPDTPSRRPPSPPSPGYIDPTPHKHR